MNSAFSRLIALFLLVFSCIYAVEENFLLMNNANEIVFELGPHINQRITTCSTFKIALSLMGYDAEILKDEKNPTWSFQEGYDDYLESWKVSQTPQSWMKNSCVWYSKILATLLGMEKIQTYLASFEYGNQDMSGGLTNAWRSSSLKISPKETVEFIQKMIHEKLPVSRNSMQMTKRLLFLEELPEGWKLFGKTGWGTLWEPNGTNLEVGWFVGWIEKDNVFFPFAYNIREKQIDLAQRIPRVKQLLSQIFTEVNSLVI